MRNICFVIPSIEISGGINVVFEHAIRINRRGNYIVFVVAIKKYSSDDLRYFHGIEELNIGTFDEFNSIEFDAVIATSWATCYEITRLRAKSYIYFNQSVESKFFKENKKDLSWYSESTYYLGLHIITEATWIKTYLKDNYNIDAMLVLNGINKNYYESFGPSIEPRVKNKLRVLIEGPLNIWYKNTEKTIKLCRESLADEIWLLTSSDIKSYPKVDRVISKIPNIKTAEVYRSCDVLVKLSYIEGMFGPPLEMFHCGGTAIVYDVSGYDEYIVNGYNGIVVATDNESEVVNSINQLKMDVASLEELKENALATAQKWYDWESSSLLFENEINNLLLKEQYSQAQIINRVEHFRDCYNSISSNNHSFRKMIRKIPFITAIKECIKKNGLVRYIANKLLR